MSGPLLSSGPEQSSAEAGLASGWRPSGWRPSGWRLWFTVLLPFAALGLLPWWVCLTLCAALVLSRLGDDARSVAALLVLLAAVAVSLPLLFGSASGRLVQSGTLFARAAGVGLGALWSMRALEGGQRRGLLLPAAAVVFFPQAGALVALLLAGLGLNGAETRPALKIAPGRSGWALAPLLAGVLLLGGALLLGQLVSPAPARAPLPTATATAAPDNPARTGSGSARAAPQGQSRAAPTPPAAPPPPDDQDLLLRPLVPFTGLLIVVCMLLLLQRTRLRRADRRSSWAGYLAIVGLLGTLFMLGILGAGAGPGETLSAPPGGNALPPGVGAAPSAARAGAARPEWLPLVFNVAVAFSTLLFGALAIWLYLSLRAARGELEQGTEPPSQAGGAATARLPLHRVRQAWRGLETVLAGAGLARQQSETPEEFTARVALQLPAAESDLQTLTQLYLPVRYGGVLSEADAEVAEASAKQIQSALKEASAAT